MQTLFYLLRWKRNWVYFLNVDSIMQNVGKFSKIARKCLSREKKWPAVSQRKPIFNRKHLPKRSCRSRTKPKLIVFEGDCSFFSLRYYSWEVGKERRKLTFMGSTCCLAQTLHRLLLPSEVHYLLKVWGVSQFRVALQTSLPKQNQRVSLALGLAGRKPTGTSRDFNLQSEAWISVDWSNPTNIWCTIS